MKGDLRASVVLAVLSGIFLLLGRLFLTGWGEPTSRLYDIPPTDGVFTNTATVRLSAEELIESGGDASGMDCYSCHEEGKEIELKYDENNQVITPPDHRDFIFSRMNCPACHRESEEVEMDWDDDGNIIIPDKHKNLVLRHGRFGRNNNCFNCHIPTQLNHVKTRQGRELELSQSTLLCASCHGPTYQDWEVGVHGRTSGYWDRDLGSITRKDCTSCHDPHAPDFPSMIPGPAPHPLHSPPEELETQEEAH